jgi:hypothetical protein
MTLKPSFSDLTYRLTPPVGGAHLRPQVKREEWLWNGQLHSVDDHPAVIIRDGEELQWYTHGLRHRDELLGPAWSKPKAGAYTYYAMGEIHRTLGPAMIMPHIEKWYRHGKLHRGDGPAIFRTDSPENMFELYVEWAWNGSTFSSLEGWAEASNCDPELYVMLKLKYA